MSNAQDIDTTTNTTTAQDMMDASFIPSGKLPRPLDTEHTAAEEQVRAATGKAFAARDKKSIAARKIEEKMGRTLAQIAIYQNAVDNAKAELADRNAEVEQMDLLIDAAVEARAQANTMRDALSQESLRYHSIPKEVREGDPSLENPLKRMRAAIAERDGLVDKLETAINKVFYNH